MLSWENNNQSKIFTCLKLGFVRLCALLSVCIRSQMVLIIWHSIGIGFNLIRIHKDFLMLCMLCIVYLVWAILGCMGTTCGMW